MIKPWYKTAYRRNCVDMHISDFNEAFLSEFDADRYVELLAQSQVQSAVVYAQSVFGKTLYPTQVGAFHHNLKGRNIVQEVIERCHARDIAVVLYLSLVWDTWSYRYHPDWRVTGTDGRGIAELSRSGLCCPNSPYRDYTAALALEICETFQVEGIRFDMTFWPRPCYCRHCRKRFAEEVGGEIPTVVNWEDPRWVAFQRRREQWLIEFAARQTAVVHQVNPDLSVEHQASTYPHLHGWRFGVVGGLAEQNTFLQGDFYGTMVEGSFVRKLFYNLTPHQPACFETSVAVDLLDYTAVKPSELLEAKVFAALADGCAFLFIDSIDPVGTLNPLVYQRMGAVFEKTKVYEPYLGGALCQDVAVYLSLESKFDFADNGKSVDDPSLSLHPPHIEAAVSACKALRDHHLPFGVITDKNLDKLSQHRVLVLPNVLMMDEREIAAIREFVRAGGCLYASKFTSLFTKDGQRQRDFLLADVFGVHYSGETRENYTYIAPAVASAALFAPYTVPHPIGLRSGQIMLRPARGVEVLGELVLPFTDPADPIGYASLHNNPPGLSTGLPAVTGQRYGQGQVVYVSGELERYEAYRDVFVRLIRRMAPTLSFEADAPKAVEATLFHQPENHRWIVNLVNFQTELPNLPVDGICVRVNLAGRRPLRLVLLPDQSEIRYAVKDGYLEFTAPRLETFAMFALEYAE